MRLSKLYKSKIVYSRLFIVIKVTVRKQTWENTQTHTHIVRNAELHPTQIFFLLGCQNIVYSEMHIANEYLKRWGSTFKFQQLEIKDTWHSVGGT